MSDITAAVLRARTVFERLEGACVECGACTRRCDLLEPHAWNLHALSELSRAALADVDGLDALRNAIDRTGDLYRFVRCCEECNRCTVHCPQGLSMSELWQPWRELVRISGHIADAEVGLVKVDCTWDTFSTFRAVQGIDYRDLARVWISPIDADTQDIPGDAIPNPACPGATLFFPGCTLASYAPELTRTAFSWLDEHAGPCLITEQCCAWPLECVGEMQRAVAWRERLVAAARDAGVVRIVTVCPGCERQLAAAANVVAPDMQFVSLARLMVEAGVRVEPDALVDLPMPATVVDSCNDRAGTHGPFVRHLFENVDCRPFPCTGEDAWCCGAGGNVASYDERIPRLRTRRSFKLCAQAGAHTLITACPTCAYTYAFERWMSARESDTADATSIPAPASVNFLELVFGMRIDWPAVFNALGDMWQGEHGAWVAQQLS